MSLISAGSISLDSTFNLIPACTVHHLINNFLPTTCSPSTQWQFKSEKKLFLRFLSYFYFSRRLVQGKSSWLSSNSLFDILLVVKIHVKMLVTWNSKDCCAAGLLHVDFCIICHSICLSIVLLICLSLQIHVYFGILSDCNFNDP